MRSQACRCLLCACLAAASLPVAAVQHWRFQDSSRIHVLDRWNADQSYAHAYASAVDPGGLGLMLRLAMDDWRYDVPNDYPTVHPISLRIDFAPGTPALGALAYGLHYDGNHGTDTFDWSDDAGVFQDETGPGVTFRTSLYGRTHVGAVNTTFPTRTGATFVRYDTTVSKESAANPGTTVYAHHLFGLDSRAGAGQVLQINGSGYSVFYDSTISTYAISTINANPALYREAHVDSNMVNAWLDGNLQTLMKPPYSTSGTAPRHTEWIIVPFQEVQGFYGARLPLYDQSRSWDQLTLEVSPDMTAWTQVFYTDTWRSTAANDGWLTFGTGLGSVGGVQHGQYVRLSWWTKPLDSYTEVEARDFQLFVIPEPTCAWLLVLGTAAWCQRRRRR